ncbi:serine protease [Streptomyces yerevanensis]|uniref:serine protease n=1 Tax=Streptomyces yerevanensis TaxID=66378 RepID=UPI0007C4609D|nr:serine protease [Streptomyces yerevanensis]
MIPADSPADRSVVVLGEQQGSGVALNSRLVLTCAHVIGTDTVPEVAHPRLAHRTTAKVIWRHAGLDAALVLTDGDLPCSSHVRVGHLDTDRPLPQCETIGYPDVQRHGTEGHLAADQYAGTVLPAAARPRTVLTFAFDQPPAMEHPDGTSPLAGLSGAPVFAGDVLLGIVTDIPRGRAHLRAEGTLISELTDLPYDLPNSEAISHHHPLDRAYEREYAHAVGDAHRRSKLFGLDDLNRRESEWDLDTAYLSLEAAVRVSESEARNLNTTTTRQWSVVGRTPQRVDMLLSTRPRVLLRGDAGAGKTTLVWWLAAHAAEGTLSPSLAGLNSLVPFVIPLRSLRAHDGALPSPSQLPRAARLVIDEPPDGWVGRVLRAGRALLLVDGLDEVPQAGREEAHRWLSALLRRYPRTRCVATVRPLAVEPDWLESEQFEELRLLPMRDDDIQTFIAGWHRAARLDDDGHHDQLRELERDLSQQFRHNPALSDLARTPLLCAVICALHRRRQGFLPETRFKLYQSALEMLLGNRDRRRRVDAPDGIAMTVEEHHQILQRIAVWLVRCGQSEFSRAQARPLLEAAVAGMERVRAQGSPEDVLTHLLNRSGLLQERADDSYQFIHRTFQDFLAAKELVESGSLQELVRNAEDELWQDVILLAAGHCRREIGELLDGLLMKADAPNLTEALRTQLHVLAALCAEHAAWLEQDRLHRVRGHIADLVASLEMSRVPQLARLGPYALPFLPGPETLTVSQQRAAAQLVGKIGGSESIPYARRLASAPNAQPTAILLLVNAWNNFPAESFAREVLANLRLDAYGLPVTTKEQLAVLHLVPTASGLTLSGPFSSNDLRAARLPPIRSLRLDRLPHLKDLHFLHPHANRISTLTVADCPSLTDISAVSRMTSLHRLSLRLLPHLPIDALRHFLGAPELTSLTLTAPNLTAVSSVPVHLAVAHLALPARRLLDTAGLEAWESLTEISVPHPLSPSRFWQFIRDSGRITRVTTSADSLPDLRRGGAVPSVTDLRINEFTDGRDLEVLPTTFPALTRLTLGLEMEDANTEVDLRPLHALPDLTLRLRGTTGRDVVIVGGELFDIPSGPAAD